MRVWIRIATRLPRSIPDEQGIAMGSRCIDCNACCKGLVVFLSRDDFFRVPQEYIDYVHGRPHLRQQGDHEHTCAALDAVNGHCTIYDNRPERCRQFSEESTRCRLWRKGKPMGHGSACK